VGGGGARLARQRGISLLWAVIVSALLAAIAMAALFSMRQDRNLFAEAWHKAAGGDAARQAMDAASKATGAAPAQVVLRKCLIDGKTVVSNVDCKDGNKTSKTIEIHDSHGFGPLAPKPPPEKNEPTSNAEVDKMIEKQLR
jgi:type II secretory pathway pseudopilin PulG